MTIYRAGKLYLENIIKYYSVCILAQLDVFWKCSVCLIIVEHYVAIKTLRSDGVRKAYFRLISLIVPLNSDVTMILSHLYIYIFYFNLKILINNIIMNIRILYHFCIIFISWNVLKGFFEFVLTEALFICKSFILRSC